MTSAYLVATFFIANLSDHLGAFTFLRYLSPFYHYLHARTLVAGVSFDPASMATLLAAAAAAIAGAWLLFLRRDAGGVSLARVHHTRPAEHTFRPGVFWRRSLWLNWIAEQRWALAAWFLGIVAFTTIEAAVVPAVMKLIGSNGGSVRRFLQTNGVALTNDQYLSFFVSFTALLVAGFTVTQVGRWASDAAQHRIDVVLALPVSWWRMLVERTVALVVASAIIGSAVVLGIWLGAAIGAYAVEPAGLARSFVDIVVLCFAIGGVGLAAVTALRSAAAVGVTGALLVGSFFLTTMAGLLSWPTWAARPSVFDAFGTPYLSMPAIGSVIYLLALGTGGVLAAYAAMRRGARVAV
jgi:putative exporter of polyketide antibiotics